MTPARYRDGARKVAPIGIAAFAFGASYGVLAQTSGFGSVEAIVMSATTFAGSAQFAAASILGAGGGVVSAIVAATLLNARYAPDQRLDGACLHRRLRSAGCSSRS